MSQTRQISRSLAIPRDAEAVEHQRLTQHEWEHKLAQVFWEAIFDQLVKLAKLVPYRFPSQA